MKMNPQADRFPLKNSFVQVEIVRRLPRKKTTRGLQRTIAVADSGGGAVGAAAPPSKIPGSATGP